MSKGTTPPHDDLVPVAVAARQLGIAPRQVRRYAEKLGDRDRTPRDMSPLRVRVSSVRVLMEQAPRRPKRAQDTSRDIEDKVGTMTRDALGTVPRDNRDTEVLRLQAELDRKDLQLQAAERELAAVRRERDTLEGYVSDLRRLLPPAPEEQDTTRRASARRRPWWPFGRKRT